MLRRIWLGGDRLYVEQAGLTGAEASVRLEEPDDQASLVREHAHRRGKRDGRNAALTKLHNGSARREHRRDLARAGTVPKHCAEIREQESQAHDDPARKEPETGASRVDEHAAEKGNWRNEVV